LGLCRTGCGTQSHQILVFPLKWGFSTVAFHIHACRWSANFVLRNFIYVGQRKTQSSGLLCGTTWMMCSGPYRSTAAFWLRSSRVTDPCNDGTNLQRPKTVIVARQKGEMDVEMKKRIRGFICLWLFPIVFQLTAWPQQAPSVVPPANVSGKWTLYCNDPNGTTSTKYLDLQQEGTAVKGHFKGPNQSGGVEGMINEQHLVVRTKTRGVLVFRGRIDGPRVNGVVIGNTFSGTFHDRGGTGTFQGQRTQ